MYMTKHTKAIVFTLIVSTLAITIIVYRYEFLIKELKKQQSFGTVKGGTDFNKLYSANEIIALIKSSKEYIGDSITVYDNGKMSSTNGKFQGTLNAVIDSRDNLDMVKANMNFNRLPLQYNIYILAATYYRRQYPEEFKSQGNN